MNDQLDRIIIGSCILGNVERIRSAIDQNFTYVVVDSLEKFEQELQLDAASIFLTDLNLVDGFPTVIFDSIQDICEKIPIIVLLEGAEGHSLYRERAHYLLEILPMAAIEDKRFKFLLLSSKFKIGVWSKYL